MIYIMLSIFQTLRNFLDILSYLIIFIYLDIAMRYDYSTELQVLLYRDSRANILLNFCNIKVIL